MTNSTTTSTQEGFGAELATARKKKSMSTEQVATELNLLRRHVEAIESEDFKALPEKAFALGYVKNYARLVGLDGKAFGERFLAAYSRHAGVESIKSPMQPMGTLRRGRAPIRLNFALIAGILAVLIFGVAILKMINSATNASKSSDNTPREEQVADSLSVSEQAQGAAIGNSGSAIAGAVQNSGTGVLDFWVKEPTIIKVTDAVGADLMKGQQNRGGYQLTGQPPFKIEITNPTQVDLNFNQSPVDLKPHTTGNTATLNLQ